MGEISISDWPQAAALKVREKIEGLLYAMIPAQLEKNGLASEALEYSNP